MRHKKKKMVDNFLDPPPSSGGSSVASVMNPFHNCTCLELHLRESLICGNCANWKLKKIMNPGKMRRSKCHKPWQINEQNVKTSKVCKLQTAVHCWAHFFSNDLVKEYPVTIEDAALKITMKLPRTHQETALPASSIASHILHSTVSSPLVKARPRMHLLSPNTMQSPTERRMRRKKPKKQETTNQEIQKKESLWNKISNLNINDIIDKSCSSLLATNEQQKEGELTEHQGDEMQPHHMKEIMTDEIEKLEAEIESLKIDKTSVHFISMRYKDELDKILKMNEELNFELGHAKLKANGLSKQIEILNKNQAPKNGYAITLSKLAFNNMNKAKQKNSNIVKQLQRGKFVCDDKFCRRLLGEIMATHPSISFNSAADIVSLARAQLLSQVNFFQDTNLTLNEVAVSSPSETTLRTILNETTADILFMLHNKIFYLDKLDDGSPPAVYLSCDKGPNGNLIKIISWYSSSSDKVEQIVLDVDHSYGCSKQCAEAM